MENLRKTAAIETRPREASIPDMSVVIVTWNNREYLEPCLQSLNSGGLESTFDVVVVDNGSTDGSQQMLQEKFPDVMIIQNDQNLGLGRASNQGIVATHGRYVLLLNDDTLVNGPSLDSMVKLLNDEPNAGAVGGPLLNEDGSVQSCYNNFPTLHEELLVATRIGELIRPGYPAIMDDDQVQQVSWIGSASLMLRRIALDEVGLLDEEYFIYGDEADLQYRLAEEGWKTYYLPQATTIHFGGRSMKRWPRRKMVYRGKMLFFKKNFGPIRMVALKIMVGTTSLAKMLVWGFALLLPGKRELAKRELWSNHDVVQLCLKLE